MIIGSCQRSEQTEEHESDDDASCNWCTWNSPQRSGKEASGNENVSKN